jgi:hypothetical protein
VERHIQCTKCAVEFAEFAGGTKQVSTVMRMRVLLTSEQCEPVEWPSCGTVVERSGRIQEDGGFKAP